MGKNLSIIRQGLHTGCWCPIYSIAFIISAVLSRSIRSKLINEARTLNQPTHVINMTTAVPPQNLIALVPQPTEPVVGKLNDHLPSYTQSNFTTIPPSSEAGCPSPAGDGVQDPNCGQKN